MVNKNRVLVVENDDGIRQNLFEKLNILGFTIGEAHSGEKALQCLRQARFDAVLLDLNISDMDGKEVCRQICHVYPRLPTIVLSVRDEEEDVVESLDLGAWDYITKPFRFPELAARLRAVIRRNNSMVHEPELIHVIGDITLDQNRRVVEKNGKEIRLPPKEYEILCFLMQNAGRPMRHDRLLAFTGGPHQGGEREYLRVIINQLRKKIEDNPRHPTYIVTENHIGYRFRERSGD